MKLIKKLLFFTLVGSVKVTVAQMGVYAEYVTKSDALFLPMSDITMTVNIKPGACLQEVKKEVEHRITSTRTHLVLK